MAKLQQRPSHLPPRPNPMEGIHLPVEILEQIIRHIPGSDASVALSASNKITRTLYNCSLVSTAMTAASIEQLYRRCLYIDSPWRLRALVRSYTSKTTIPGKSADPSILRRNASTAMFLKPFSSFTIDEFNVVASLGQLFDVLSTTLRRLVIDMPLRSYYREELGGPNLGLNLRSAFLKLKAVEEFTSVRDELYLSTMLPSNSLEEPPVWSLWPFLRRLALYNLDMSEELGDTLNAMPALKTLILTRPDREEDFERLSKQWNAKLHIGVVNTHRDFSETYRRHLDHSSTQKFGSAAIHRLFRSLPSEEFRPLPIVDIICVDGQKPVRESRADERSQTRATFRASNSNNWAAYDLRNTFNDIRECQEWVKRNAINDTLWPESSPNWPPKPVESMVKATSRLVQPDR